MEESHSEGSPNPSMTSVLELLLKGQNQLLETQERMMRQQTTLMEEMLQKLNADRLVNNEPNASPPIPTIIEATEPTVKKNVMPDMFSAITQHYFKNDRPYFYGYREENPYIFLDNFQNFIKPFSYVDSEKLSVVFDCLRGHAKQWFVISKSNWTSYNDFETAFLKVFWSENKQRQLRLKIINSVYNSHKRSMTEHFVYMVSQAKYLQTLLPESTIVADIMQHFPMSVRTAWALQSKKSIPDAILFLNTHDSLLEPPAKRVRTNPINNDSSTKPVYQANKPSKAPVVNNIETVVVESNKSCKCGNSAPTSSVSGNSN